MSKRDKSKHDAKRGSEPTPEAKTLVGEKSPEASTDEGQDGQKEVWVRVDSQGRPLPDQEATLAELQAKLATDKRVHGEALGDAWAVLLGQPPSANIMGQVAATVLHAGGTRPAWQWKHGGKDYVLMAWPQDQPVRASLLMAGPEGGKLTPVTSAPLLEGLPNDLTVAEVHVWANAADADVAVSMIEGKKPMWFHDPLYVRDKDDLTVGITHTFLLAGLALALRKALLDEVTITQGPAYESHAQAWLAANEGKSRLDVPPLKVDVHNKHLVMPGRHFGEYQMRATVESLQECQLEKMPVTILYLSFPFQNRPAMRLPVYASKMVLGDYSPKEGDEVDAYVWLQGRVIDMDAAEPEAH